MNPNEITTHTVYTHESEESDIGDEKDLVNVNMSLLEYN